VPFEPGAEGKIAQIRPWVWGGGGVLTVESPRSLFDVLEVFEEAGLRDPLTGYLGEPPALSAKKWTLRRAASSGTNWHQDGAFRHGITRSTCGYTDALRRRRRASTSCRTHGEILPTGTEGAIFDWSVGDPVVERAAVHAPVQRPVFEPGDALLFDDYFLHRTAVSEAMRNERYAIGPGSSRPRRTRSTRSRWRSDRIRASAAVAERRRRRLRHGARAAAYVAFARARLSARDRTR
jgi:hypothetical protein